MAIPDSVRTMIAGKQYQKSWLYTLFWGKHYRNVWAEPVQVKTLNLRTEFGGLKPLKMGGSFQTKNLRLVNPEGKEFVLRSIDKDPTKALPERLQKTFIAELMRDQTSVIHPYGAFIVPPLANAAGVYHTNPTLWIVPDDPALGEFQEEFANMLVLLEERPDGDQEEVISFGNAKMVVSSRKAFEAFISSGCNYVNARLYLKSRLFDMWLGDWSRREDQWRWGIFATGDQARYESIPRDRDHAFFKFNDGLLTWLGSKIKTNYQTFGPNIKHIKGLNRSARPMDEYLLAYLRREDFKQIADSLQNSLTDAVIEKATHLWPDNIYALTGKTFEKKFKSRRDQLSEIANDYYELLAEEVLLAGTDKKERFVIERLNKSETKITVYSKSKSNCPDLKIGERVFSTKDTKSVSVYGLGGNDEFVILGEAADGVKLNIFGGEGEDEIMDTSLVKGFTRKTRIYEPGDGNTIKPGARTKVINEYKPLAEDFNGTGWLLRHRLH